MGDLQDEKNHLINYIQVHLKVAAIPGRDKLVVESENVTLSDLHHAVKKYVASRHGVTHYVSLEGSTVKINRFKGREKKKEKHDKGFHQTPTQSWGL